MNRAKNDRAAMHRAAMKSASGDHASSPRLCLIAGTRPEFIKLAPVLHALRQRPETRNWPVRFIATGQHPDLTGQMCRELDIMPDDVLSLPAVPLSATDEGLGARLAALLSALAPQVEAHADIVVVQGDTHSALAGAMAGSYARRPVMHVEAGLRTGLRHAPFPEELNRCQIATHATVHFAPTPLAVRNLLTESINPDSIFCVGNTVIDAIARFHPRALRPVWPRPHILATCHRRENWDGGLAALCSALAACARLSDTHDILFLAHPNPALLSQVRAILGDQPRIYLLPPQPYRCLLSLLDGAAAVVTDSGGLQEEASMLGVPVVLCREATERPEILSHGGWLAGCDPAALLRAIRQALGAPRPPAGRSPFGDGKAADRIVTALVRFWAGQRPYLKPDELFDPNRPSDADAPLNNRKAFAIGAGTR
ncbi:non-hydrolyzing UDP-N-acetylglucosamine 2-epimerase [Pedomonas sp. V897]|uniref:non-hydrolyzing UDP-N-acetylglucosamine 2-epimerase n=1 Tax=Pedomonas sp. V897 TaxID=3446482 RepID=UPI003EDF2F35